MLRNSKPQVALWGNSSRKLSKIVNLEVVKSEDNQTSLL